ncbi:MAG: YvrJ family protein [Clostridium sp.]
MEINDFITIIGNMGFPVAISAYLLIRLEKHLISLTSSINLLNTIVSTKLGVVIDGK